jgi:cellobiose phosphorylase
MRYGHFDDSKKEYVIERPDTPRSWSNYLGSTRYGAIITNNAGGYSFFHSAANGRFLRLRFNGIPMDQPGRNLYVRDNADGDFWSAAWQPVGKPLDQYRSECRHGTAYTVITSAYRDISTETTYFVPLGKDYECWVFTVRNKGATPRKLSVFTYCEFANNWSTLQDLINLQFSQYCIKGDARDGMMRIALLDNLPEDPAHFINNDQSRHMFMTVVGAKPSGFDTDREAFLGPYRSYDRPLVVEQGHCTGSTVHGDNGCGTWQVDLDLAPGETREFVVVLGVGKADREGAAARVEIKDVASARRALEEVKAHWHGKLGALTVQTPDAGFNSMVNVWNAYNCLITYAWSRAASLVYNGERDGLGYRDSVQDMLGVLPTMPREAGERLELLLTGQVSTGGAMPVVKPFAHRPGHEEPTPEHSYRSDDCLWLFVTVPAYVKETGDLAFYDKVLPYSDKGEATVLGHLRQAIQFNLDRRGAHGLPCGLDADWNDCLRFGHKGESLFVTFQLRLALVVYADIARRLERPTEAAWADAALHELDAAIAGHAWDGRWFLRGFYENGKPLGTARDEEGRIFLEPQPWAVMSGAGTPEQLRQAMDSVQAELSTPWGVMICNPPFVKTPHHVVRAVLFNTGQKENAAIFCHTQGWAVIAEALLRRSDRAYAYYRAYMPAAYNDRAEVRQVEPYVHCQSTHSIHSKRAGASRVPWLSGTAAWSYYAATQYILGIQPDYEGLRIDPCLPAEWPEITVQRVFRGHRFDIRIRRGATGCGVRKLTLNGVQLEGNLLPINACADANQVEVELG